MRAAYNIQRSTSVLDNNAASTAGQIRECLTGCPAVPITSDSGMSTFDELKCSAQKRRDNRTRGVQLEQDIDRLRKNNRGLQDIVEILEAVNTGVSALGGPLRQISRTLTSLAVSTGLVVRYTATIAFAGCAGVVVAEIAAVGKVGFCHLPSRHKAAIANNTKAMAVMTAEAGSGVVYLERLRRDEDTLKMMNDLDS